MRKLALATFMIAGMATGLLAADAAPSVIKVRVSGVDYEPCWTPEPGSAWLQPTF